MENKGKKITLFLVDGEPDGIKTLELAGKSILGFIFPRNKLRDFSKEENARKPGVYFLFGKESEDSLVSTAYIGHSDNVADRLNTHNNDESKDFWSQTVVFVSKDDTFTPTHAKYIESRCVRLANEVKHFGYHLVNGNSPQLPNMSDTDIPVMDEFLSDLSLFLGVVGYLILQKTESKTKHDNNDPLFFCQSSDGSIQATARMTTSGFLVYKGSTATVDYREHVRERNNRIIDRLIAGGIVKKDADKYTFEQDYAFNSPSAAANLIVGYSVNGWDLWKSKSGKTLDEIYRKK